MPDKAWPYETPEHSEGELTSRPDPVSRLGEIRARRERFDVSQEDVGWLLEHIEQLQADSAGNAAGLRYWNRRYVETARQHAVDIAVKDAYRAERDELKAQRRAVLDLCDPAPKVAPTPSYARLIASIREALGAE